MGWANLKVYLLQGESPSTILNSVVALYFAFQFGPSKVNLGRPIAKDLLYHESGLPELPRFAVWGKSRFAGVGLPDVHRYISTQRYEQCLICMSILLLDIVIENLK